MKRWIAGLSALVCCAGAAAYFPDTILQTEAMELVHNDFEVNYDGWYENAEHVKLTAAQDTGYAYSRGMTVSGRKDVTDGASSSKGFYLTGGETYTYSVQVYSETEETFHFTLTCLRPETGEYETKELAVKQVKAGEWTTLAAEYEAPEDSAEFTLSLRTDSTADFSFDNVTVTGNKPAFTASAAVTDHGLKDVYANYFRVGNILNWSTINDAGIRNMITTNFNSIEGENETKPDATMVQSQSTNTNIAVSLQSAAAIFDFCIENNIAVRGHTLVWHSQTPSWVFKDNLQDNGNWVSTQVMDQRLESYIRNLFGAIETQYPALNLYAYDVANECISDDSSRTKEGMDGARVAGDNKKNNDGSSAWVSVYGNNSFVEKAFSYARKYAPEGCDLYYNDYNEYWDHKRDCIYRMCKDLYEKGLLDGVGMQSHINADASGFSGTQNYINAMHKYLSIGCDVQITELDISCENGKFTEQQQAQKYADIFKAAVDWNKNPQSTGRVTAVCIWGPNDANTWIGSENKPLLFNEQNQPKAAYTAVANLLPESEWGDGRNPVTGGETRPVEPDANGWYFHDRFEGSTDSWQGRGAASVSTSGRTAYKEAESLLVQDRESAWNGAAKKLSANPFKPGEEFSFSANVMYFDGSATDTFYMKLQYEDAQGETHYSTIAEATAIKGEWVQLVNTKYRIPEGAANMQLYIETADSTSNFYVDEAIGAVGGTGILGAGGGDAIIKGDVTGDGIINVLDLVAAKNGVKGEFKKSSAKIAADVDESGVVDDTDIALLQDFILKRIDEFPIAEKVIVTTPVDVAAMESLFSSVTPAASYKKEGESNPLYTQRFGADPGVMEYNGRVYVYMTNDVIERDSNGKVGENTYALINQINCISSDDMVNWTDHGAIPAVGPNGIAKWAGCSWAPCAAHKTINGKEKFFLYFCNGGNGVCVLTADSPTGPWSDPLGHELVTRAVPNCNNIPWLFDPAVMVDDDGTGYLCFGGGVPDGQQAMPSTTRVVQLGDDMISLVGTPATINAPYMFEDSGINKIGNKYYYTYCSNWSTGGNNYGLSSAGIQYMVSDNPLGPYTYGGEFFKNQGNFFPGMTGNNHHSIVELNGQLYLFYHSRPVEKAMGIDGNYRSPQVDKITMSGDKMNAVTGTMTGIPQLKKLNPYDIVPAETMSSQSIGINVAGLGDTVVNGITKGAWTKVTGVSFTNGTAAVTLRASSKNGASVKICTGSVNGDAIAYAEIPAGGSMQEITVATLSNVSGTKDLYFVFSGDAEFDSWQFQ